MLVCEFKKLFSKTSTKVLIVLLTLILASFSAYNVFSANYVLEDGVNRLSGISAIQKMKEEKSKWNGILDEEAIAKVIEKNTQINQKYDPYSNDVTEANQGFSRKQGFQDIRDMLSTSFNEFRSFDYYKVDSLIPSDAAYFYTNRENQLTSWLNEDGESYYSKGQIEYYIDNYKKMPTPLKYSYQDGWNKIFGSYSSLLLFTVVIICLIVASIFSQEFSTKADSILLSTTYGRSKAIRTKVYCGLITSAGFYVAVVSIFSLIILGIYGFDGYDCLIQSNNVMGWYGWKSIYYISNLTALGWIFISGLIGTVFISILTMFVSYKLKSTIFASVVAFLLIIIPDWLSGFVRLPVLKSMLELWPDQLLGTSRNLMMFNMLEIGDMFVSPIWLMSGLYTVLAVVLCFWIVRSSKRLYLH